MFGKFHNFTAADVGAAEVGADDRFPFPFRCDALQVEGDGFSGVKDVPGGYDALAHGGFLLSESWLLFCVII